MIKNTSLRAELKAGRTVYGPFIKACNAPLIEILGHSGMDYILLDMEHSPVSMEKLEDLIRAAEVAGIFPFVRVADVREADITHPLDKGARGLLVPMVNNRATAERVVQCAAFNPRGRRGMDIYARSARFGFSPKNEYLKRANTDLILALQIEGQEGISNLDDILEVEGIDIIYIGPYDLSQSMGLPGQVNDPRVIDEIRRICERVKKAGCHLGIYVDDVETAHRYREFGIQFITIMVDVVIFSRACNQLVADLRG